jgi:uncharacterized membrane protein YedE/YeeE
MIPYALPEHGANPYPFGCVTPHRIDPREIMTAEIEAGNGRPMVNLTPLSAAIGGALIGLSAALLMLLSGRVAGISGIFGGCFVRGASDRGWRLAFVGGLILAPVSAMLAGYDVPLPAMPTSWWLVIGAGLLVGFGSRMGNGCTSGHGVCGIARLSPRSITATVVFMVTAAITVALMRHDW